MRCDGNYVSIEMCISMDNKKFWIFFFIAKQISHNIFMVQYHESIIQLEK